MARPKTYIRIYFESEDDKKEYKKLVAVAASDMQKRITAFLRLDLSVWKMTQKILPLDIASWLNPLKIRDPSLNVISDWVALWDLEVLSQKSFIPLERIAEIAAGDNPDYGELSKLFRVGLSPEKIKDYLDLGECQVHDPTLDD